MPLSRGPRTLAPSTPVPSGVANRAPGLRPDKSNAVRPSGGRFNAKTRAHRPDVRPARAPTMPSTTLSPSSAATRTCLGLRSVRADLREQMERAQYSPADHRRHRLQDRRVGRRMLRCLTDFRLSASCEFPIPESDFRKVRSSRARVGAHVKR